MANNQVCVGDCLRVNSEGFLEIVTDNETIKCVDDGSGTPVLKSFGSSGFTDWDSDFDCDITTGQKVYRQDGTDNLYTESLYEERSFGGHFDPIPDINQLLSGNGNVIRSSFHTLTNNDPCGRDLCATVEFNWNSYSLNIPQAAGPIGTGLHLKAEIYSEELNSWQEVSSSGFCNYADTQVGFNPGTTNYFTCISIPKNQSVDIGMRWVTGTSDKHTPSPPGGWQASPIDIYGTLMRWDITSNCDNVNCNPIRFD